MVDKVKIQNALHRCALGFEKILYEEDVDFMKGMQSRCLAGDDIRKYQFWEWTQGVGLYGFWKLYEKTGKNYYLDVLLAYYDRQMKIGFPAKNVNTTTPLLALSFLAENQNREDYRKVCKDWAEWIMQAFPRTREGGFQHITSDSVNHQELWDDTLFMTVLFLANMGRILNNESYIEEAKYQFLVHAKYLTDRPTGLWYHGWTFDGNHNFAEALWGRGNCWITAAIPELLEMLPCEHSFRRYMTELLKRQAESLEKYQDESGMWHTLVDDATSYVESSATCGFGYGIMKGIHMGLLDNRYEECAQKAGKAMIQYVNEDGVVEQTSYGTPMGRKDKKFYKDIEIRPMPYGQALAMLFFLELLEETSPE